MGAKPSDESIPAGSDQETWHNARQYLSSLGEIPSSFTSITRSLVLDGSKESGELSPGTRFLITRLLKGRSIMAPFYFMSCSLFPDEFENRVYISEREMIDLFKPFDLASFIAILYLFKKLSIVCPSAEWTHVSSTLQSQIDVGLRLGHVIPAMGIGPALLTSSMCQLGLGAFLLHDQKGFVDYRRKLKGVTYKLDHKWEMSRWGCTSAHVGSLFIQHFGLGVTAAHAFVRGLIDPETDLANETDPEVYRYKVIKLWLNSLLDSGRIPNIAHRGRFYPEGGDVEDLLKYVSSVRGAGDEAGWLSKTKDDVSPEITPLLFRVGGKGPAAAAPPAPSAEEESDSDPFSSDPFEPA